jgi:hypothetical protein
MIVPHARSQEAFLKRQQRREQQTCAKRFVSNLGYHDNIRSEAVNRLEPEQILQHLKSVFDGVCVDVGYFVRGEVIADSRGKGTLQR